MTRLINSETPRQQRTKLLKLITTALPEIKNENMLLEKRNDLIAFIVLSLIEVEKTIINTTIPWEKREYWVKADQFRNEWAWVADIKNQLLNTKTNIGWQKTPLEIGLLKEKLRTIELSKRQKKSNFWEGAYKVLVKKK